VVQTRWVTCSGTAIGSSHLKAKKECEDFGGSAECLTSHGASVLLYVADGAGSALNAKYGSQFVCNSFVAYFTTPTTEQGYKPINELEVRAWVHHVRNLLQEQAELMECRLEDFATTFLGCILTSQGSLLVQIGDGAIVLSETDSPNEFNVCEWPDQGEYANSTTFITSSDALEKLVVVAYGLPLKHVALFTDGLQRLLLNYQEKLPHQPFFQYWFQKLGLKDEAESTLTQELNNLLHSEIVDRKTDDDRTLVLASYLMTSENEPSVRNG